MSEPATTRTETARHLLRTINIGDSRVTLLGTAHVSPASVEDVRRELASGDYDAVAVELCNSRYRAMTQPESLENMNLFQVVRDGKAGMVAASLALGAYQQRLADQFGIRPGAEMEAAIEGARDAGLPVLCIDREIGITLKRIYRGIPWWRRTALITGLLASSLSRERIDETEIERLKEGDLLESTFAEFAERDATLYQCLIAERDRFMAARLQQRIRQRKPKHLLAVVGAGHLEGLERALREPLADPAAEIAALEHTPPPSRWVRWMPWIVVAVIVAGFVAGFSQSTALGLRLVVEWVVINGGLAALGAVIAVAHPLTVLTAFVAAPLTSLNPTIGAGMVCAAAELAFRKPQVKDFRTLRQDAATLPGWWRNRVSRTLLVFFLTTLGSAAGTYIAGFRIFEQVVG
jgi:pheromone shutdown-related protein TraB